MSAAEDVESYPPDAPKEPVVGRVGPFAHFFSVVICAVLVPVALVPIDYAFSHGWTPAVQRGQGGSLGVESSAGIIVGAVLLLLVAATSRLSGLGPLLAGLVYGGIPAVLVVADPARIFAAPSQVPGVFNLYEGIGMGLVGSASVTFPLLAALLIGAGFGGRWRRR